MLQLSVTVKFVTELVVTAILKIQHGVMLSQVTIVMMVIFIMKNHGYANI